MNKTSIAAALCLGLLGAASSAHAAPRPLAKVRAAAPALPALPGLGTVKPVGLNVAGINLLGQKGSGLVAGVGVLGGQGVGHGIIGTSVMGGANSGAGLVGIAALSGTGSGNGAVSIGVKNQGQSLVHIGVLGRNVIGH